ncbi:helix-turn-helix transcriptional regulator [Muribaculum caecicola]|uniref:helix-turn-helix transcriptional regulator n=1 Tax=Muribaculum caecicola TaxID=3038144 RepID=UPI0024102D4D|nr:helix-turn-helix transcriptional regulator [Muribaculum caecicola]
MLNNNIRVERAIKRVSQQDVADAIGVTRQTIFSIENNKYVPSTELALRLSAYFGKTVNELFRIVDSKE